MIVFKTPKQHKKSASEGGRLLRSFFIFCTITSWTSKIKNIDIEYCISNGTYLLEAQLCIKISNFNGFCGHPGLWQIGCRVTRQCNNSPGKADRSTGFQYFHVLFGIFPLDISKFVSKDSICLNDVAFANAEQHEVDLDKFTVHCRQLFLLLCS